jgi:hypothetical protein
MESHCFRTVNNNSTRFGTFFGKKTSSFSLLGQWAGYSCIQYIHLPDVHLTLIGHRVVLPCLPLKLVGPDQRIAFKIF